MFSFGGMEIMVILLVALIVVGPKKLPDLAKSLGKGLREVRKATDEFKSNITENEAYKDLREIKDTFHDTASGLKDEIYRQEDPEAASASQPEPVLEAEKQIENSMILPPPAPRPKQKPVEPPGRRPPSRKPPNQPTFLRPRPKPGRRIKIQ